MNIMRTTKVVVLLVCVLFAATAARAQTVTMNFISADGNSSGGYYVFPYYFTINSGTYTNSLMCDTFTRDITNGENWPATVLAVPNLTVSNVGTLEFGSVGVPGYLEACYLYQEELSAFNHGNSDPQGLYNWAVWDLFTGTDPSAALGATDEAIIQGYLTDAESQSLTPSQFSGMYIVTPTDMAPGGPQEFFGVCNGMMEPVPEPGTLALVGLSLGVLVLIRKRK